MEAGAKANIIYRIVMKTCAKARGVAIAEHWLTGMMKAGAEANIITYSTMIKACAEARDAGTGWPEG